MSMNAACRSAKGKVRKGVGLAIFEPQSREQLETARVLILHAILGGKWARIGAVDRQKRPTGHVLNVASCE